MDGYTFFPAHIRIFCGVTNMETLKEKEYIDAEVLEMSEILFHEARKWSLGS